MLNLLNDNIKNTIIFFYIDDKKVSFESKNIKCKLEVKFENNIIKLNVNVDNNIVITEKNPQLLTDNSKDIEILEDKASQYLKELIEKFINNMKYEYKTDLLSIKSILYKSNMDAYNKVKDKFYDEYLNNITYDVKVNSYLETEGGILKKW